MNESVVSKWDLLQVVLSVIIVVSSTHWLYSLVGWELGLLLPTGLFVSGYWDGADGEWRRVFSHVFGKGTSE